MTELTAALEDLGVSPRAHSVLATALTGEYSQGEIARIVGLDKTTMVVTVDELEAAGLAERRPSSSDRRARVIVVSEAGEQKVREADRVLDRVRVRRARRCGAGRSRGLPSRARDAGVRPAGRAGALRPPGPPARLTTGPARKAQSGPARAELPM